MSRFEHLPAAAVELVVTLLLPLLLPALNGDPRAARALVLALLADCHPATTQELRLAAEAIGCSLKGLMMLARSAEAGIAPDRLEASLKWACGLARAGHQAQRRLDDLQRPRRASSRPRPAATPADVTDAAAAPAEEIPQADAPQPVAVAEPAPQAEAPTESVQPAPAEAAPAAHLGADPASDPATDLAQAEAAFVEADMRLTLMKARHKGAPPPHTQAAQQIAAQQRIVATARLKLQQARQRHAAAGQLGSAKAA